MLQLETLSEKAPVESRVVPLVTPLVGLLVDCLVAVSEEEVVGPLVHRVQSRLVGYCKLVVVPETPLAKLERVTLERLPPSLVVCPLPRFSTDLTREVQTVAIVQLACLS